MKALLIIIVAFVAWCALRSLLGNRQAGAMQDRRSTFERMSAGMAAVNAWGKYLFWICIAGGVVYALLLWPFHL